MSDDELVVMVMSLICAAVAWGVWYVVPRRIVRLRKSVSGQRSLYLTPLTAAALLILVLRTASAHDVRDDPRYLALYFFLGAAWVGVSLRCVPLAGLSTRDDVVERTNASAAYAIGGAIIAITLCFAGGNIGDGPGWWVVVFSAGLATAGLFVVWLLVEALSGVSEIITIERDKSAGLRLAGFLVACGLIFGRAVAGDWVSVDGTVRDFLVAAWPAVVLAMLAAIVERLARPTPAHPARSIVAFGIVPALLYVLGAARQVLSLGPPS